VYCFVDDGDEYSNAGDDPEILTGAGEVVIVEKQPVCLSSWRKVSLPAMNCSTYSLIINQCNSIRDIISKSVVDSVRYILFNRAIKEFVFCFFVVEKGRRYDNESPEWAVPGRLFINRLPNHNCLLF
jgi:hypothetical protein